MSEPMVHITVYDALREENARFKSIGQQFERDSRKFFEQSCVNLQRAERAETDRDELLQRNTQIHQLLLEAEDRSVQHLGAAIQAKVRADRAEAELAASQLLRAAQERTLRKTEAELAAVRKDSERWAFGKKAGFPVRHLSVTTMHINELWSMPRGSVAFDSADAAIDAALTAAGEQQGDG